MWSGFKFEIEAAFCNIEMELKLRCCLAALHWTKGMATFTKDFYSIALELGDWVPDNAALFFMYVEGLKPLVQI